MYHLTPEELARLVDEPPTLDEAAHLDACDACSAELGALNLQTAELGSLTDLAPSVDLWPRIEAAAAVNVPRTRGRWDASPVLLRAAAGVALFLIGAATGAAMAASGPGFGALADPAGAIDLSEAADALAAAEADYLRALSLFVELSDDRIGLDPLHRLAALEGIVLTTRSALRESPGDPVINNYHLTALGHRDALLRQLEQVNAEDEWF